MKFAVTTVSTPTITPEEVASKVGELGYDGIEWRVIDEPPNPRGMEFWHGNRSTIPLTDFAEQAERVRSLAESNNLQMPVLGTYPRSDSPREEIEAAMDAAVALGIPKMRVQLLLYDGTSPFRPLWDAAREQYRAVAEMAKERNLQALFETHHGTIAPSASAARAFVEGLDPAHVGVIYDPGEMVFEGFETPRMALEILGEYLAHVHLKNARWFPVKYLEDRTVVWQCGFTAVHKGIIDVRAVFRAFRAVGYDGWITLEDFSTERPLDDRLKENLAFVKKVEAETAATVDSAASS